MTVQQCYGEPSLQFLWLCAFPLEYSKTEYRIIQVQILFLVRRKHGYSIMATLVLGGEEALRRKETGEKLVGAWRHNVANCDDPRAAADRLLVDCRFAPTIGSAVAEKAYEELKRRIGAKEVHFVCGMAGSVWADMSYKGLDYRVALQGITRDDGALLAFRAILDLSQPFL